MRPQNKMRQDEHGLQDNYSHPDRPVHPVLVPWMGVDYFPLMISLAIVWSCMFDVPS